MTDEQFKQLMDKLEELKTYRAPGYFGPPTYPPPLYQPQPGTNPYYDSLPRYWIHEGARD